MMSVSSHPFLHSFSRLSPIACHLIVIAALAVVVGCGQEGETPEHVEREGNDSAPAATAISDAPAPQPEADAEPAVESEPAVEPEPAAQPAGSDPIGDAQPAAGQALSADGLSDAMRRLDFTTVRMRAAALAEEQTDPERTAYYRDLAQTASVYVQELPQVLNHFALIDGNPQQREQALAGIFQGGDLVHMVMRAIIAPDVTATDDDAAILPMVLELSRALEDHTAFTPALRRHASLPPGELREQLAIHLTQLAQGSPQTHAAALEAHLLGQDPVAVVDLMPLVTTLLLEHELWDADFVTAYRALMRQAAEQLGEDQRGLRGDLFVAAMQLDDDDFSQEIMTAIGPGGADMDGLPPGWSGGDIGELEVGGSIGLVDGRFEVRAAGSTFWGSRDEIFMAWRERSGDFRLRARLESLEDMGKWGKGGISLRQSTDDSAAHASILASPGEEDGYRIVLGHRREEGGSSSNSGTHYRSLPLWIELERKGDAIIARTSEDGEDWEEFARETVVLSDPVLAGPALNSDQSGELATMRLMIPLDDLF